MYNDLFTIGSVTIHGYGLMIALGFLAGLGLGSFRAKRRGLDADTVFTLALVGMIAGVVGAKLLHYIANIKDIIADPSLLLDVGNGFIVYGGVVAGILVAFLYSKRKKISFIDYLDLLIPSVSIAQGFGRIGCFLAGCCYGKPTEAWFGVASPYFPGIKLLPTQLFSAAGDFIITGALLLLARKQKFKGQIICGYMLLYGFGRFFIEIMRNDPRTAFGPFSGSQLMSIFVFIAGVAGMLLLFQLNKKKNLILEPVIIEAGEPIPDEAEEAIEEAAEEAEEAAEDTADAPLEEQTNEPKTETIEDGKE